MWTRLNKAWKMTITTNNGTLVTDGPFHWMETEQSLPDLFEDLAVSPADLDVEYMLTYSGQKIASPLVLEFLTGDELTNEQKETIGHIIYRANYDRWKKLADTLLMEYDPIINYDMVEHEAGTVETEYDSNLKMSKGTTIEQKGKEKFIHGEKIEDTDTRTLTKSGSITETDNNRKETEKPVNRQETTEHEVAGLNSEGYKDSEKTTTTITGTIERSKTGNTTTEFNSVKDTHGGKDTVEHSGTDTTEFENRTTEQTGYDEDTKSGKDTDTTDRTLTRKGNIGVTTSQQMIEQERRLYLWDFFRTVVFPDVDKFLTLGVY